MRRKQSRHGVDPDDEKEAKYGPPLTPLSEIPMEPDGIRQASDPRWVADLQRWKARRDLREQKQLPEEHAS